MGPVGEFEEDMPPPVFVLFVDEDGSNLSNCCMETLPFTCRYILSDFPHLKFLSQTIMFSPENHLDTRAASSPHDGSSSTLCTRTLSAFCLCWTLCCVRCIWLINWWVFSRLLQRGGARKTLQRWESRWFGKHFKQKNSNAYRPQYKSFSAGVDTWWRSTSWQAQN